MSLFVSTVAHLEQITEDDPSYKWNIYILRSESDNTNPCILIS